MLGCLYNGYSDICHSKVMFLNTLMQVACVNSQFPICMSPLVIPMSPFLCEQIILTWSSSRPTNKSENRTKPQKLEVGIADDQAKDFDFEKTEMKYDSTGMFHWTPARAIEDCILVRRLLDDLLSLQYFHRTETRLR